MPGLNLSTKLPAGTVKAPVSVDNQKKVALRSVLPPGIVSAGKHSDAVDAAKKNAVNVLGEIVKIRQDIVEMHSAVSAFRDDTVAQIRSGISDIKDRLKEASRKTPLAADVQRDSEGRIKSVIFRPAS